MSKTPFQTKKLGLTNAPPPSPRISELAETSVYGGLKCYLFEDYNTYLVKIHINKIIQFTVEHQLIFCDVSEY